MCTSTQQCFNGQSSAGGNCTCPGGESCNDCLLQPDYDGVLLVSSGEVPRSEPVDTANLCVDMNAGAGATATDLRRGCRDICRNTPACTSFFVFLRGTNTNLLGKCCPRSR